MFEFMILQVVAITLIIVFPQIATAFPEYLQKVAREAPVERVIDDAESLEKDPLMQMQEGAQSDQGSLEPEEPKPDDGKK
jgi:hypothetical protein